MSITKTTAADGAVPVHCFGERGMQHAPDRPHRLPVAAGLFGVPARHASPSSGKTSGCRRMMPAA